jgi:hypothetical protein
MHTRIFRDDWLVWELPEDGDLTAYTNIVGQKEENYNGDVKENWEDTSLPISRCNLIKMEDLGKTSKKFVFNKNIWLRLEPNSS